MVNKLTISKGSTVILEHVLRILSIRFHFDDVAVNDGSNWDEFSSSEVVIDNAKKLENSFHK